MTQTSAVDAAEDFFAGNPGHSASFENIGDKCGGIVTDYGVAQQRDYETEELEFWDEAKTQPKMQLVVSLQTEERDPMDPEDTGIRKLYIKGSKKSGSQSPHDAVATALKRAGVKSLVKGGYLEMTFVGEEPPKNKKFSPRKLYTATYNPHASADGAVADMLGTGTPAPAAQPVQQAVPAVQAQPVQQAQPASGAANPVDLAKQLIAANQPDNIIQAATSLDPVVIQALRNAG